MTRRNGTVEEQVDVLVSPEMFALREAQKMLNFFLWTTEIAYAVVSTSEDRRLSDMTASAVESLSSAHTEAWFPNSAGRIKYSGTVGDLVRQLTVNAKLLPAATFVFWHTKFESYLQARLGTLVGPVSNWGPYTASLSIRELRECEFPMRLRTVLRADLCRYVRNEIVHGREAPCSVVSPVVAKWKKSRIGDLHHHWLHVNYAREVNEAVEHVVGQVATHLRTTSSEGKLLHPTFFFALFAFANYDALAFEIEEALLPTRPGEHDSATIRRQRRHVRRASLVRP